MNHEENLIEDAASESREYTRKERARCPRMNKDVTHTILYRKATCTRVPDTILHFSCDGDLRCGDCERDYW